MDAEEPDEGSLGLGVVALGFRVWGLRFFGLGRLGRLGFGVSGPGFLRAAGSVFRAWGCASGFL